MAKFAILTEFIMLNAVDLSGYMKGGQLTIEADVLEATTFGSAGWQENIAGLRSATLEASALDDMAAAALDATLWALLAQVVSFEVRPTNAARSTSNPAYTGSVLISQHNLGGDVGKLAEKGLKFPTSGQVQRLTA